MHDAELSILREQLRAAILGSEAHADFDDAISHFPPALQGAKPAGAPHSAWQLLEHMRIAQWDILEFSRDAGHQSPPWPEGYWPAEAQPPDAGAWEKSAAQFRRDREAMLRLVDSSAAALFRPIPHGNGQTLLREALLIANHNSYHLGQLLFVKRQLTAKP